MKKGKPEKFPILPQQGGLKDRFIYRPPMQPWSKENITLLGDEDHPRLPTMGQGACNALEDAYVIAKCLKEQPDAIAAFQTYPSLRLLMSS